MVLPTLKKAVVYLLRKMPSLDPIVLENVHLISNLFFIGKVVDIGNWRSATKTPGWNRLSGSFSAWVQTRSQHWNRIGHACRWSLELRKDLIQPFWPSWTFQWLSIPFIMLSFWTSFRGWERKALFAGVSELGSFAFPFQHRHEIVGEAQYADVPRVYIFPCQAGDACRECWLSAWRL